MSYINQVSSLGPKVWYRFNETAGTPANFGSLSTTSTFTNLLLNEQTSVDGRCVYFSGTAYITLPSYPAFSLFNDKSFTIETWMKASAADIAGANAPYLFAMSGANANNQFISVTLGGASYSGARQGTVILETANGIGTGVNINSTIRVDDDQWHHVVVTINTTSIKIYIDGALAASGGGSFANAFSFDEQTNKKFIGGGGFRGRLDEFAIYDRELTASDIAANYVAGARVNFVDTVGTASALMVDPTVSASFNPAAQAPMTASAASGDHYNSTVTFPKLLNTYMGELSLETWFKFDESRALTNYGTGTKQNANWIGDILNNVSGGIQGSGSISLKGSFTNTNITQIVPAGQKAAMASQCEDEDFTIGFWIKKETKEATDAFVNIVNGGGSDLVRFLWNADGGITFRINANNNDHDVASSTDITDGEWHFVAGRLASNTMQLWIDNVSIGTTTMNHTIVLTNAQFTGGGSTDYFSISQFFISTSTNVNSTQIANIYDYGTPTFTEAAAYMPPASAKFDSAFNIYIQSKSPLFDFRMDEGSGVPVNYGSATITLAPDLDPAGYTQNEPGLNNRTFKFTNRNQAVRGSFTVPTGTLSTTDTATLGVLFKTNWKTLPHIHAALGGTNTSALGFDIRSNTNGTARVFYGLAGGSFGFLDGTTDFSDDKWHLAIAVADGTNIKLYVDGKLEASTTATIPFSDSNQFAIGSPALGVQGGNATFLKYVDEAFATNTAFTAQEAFEAYQALRLEMETTATALMVDPTTILGTGNIYTADPATASGLFVEPTEEQEIAPIIVPMDAFGVFQHPNYGGNVVIDVNYGQTAFAADAIFHMPGFSIGEINSVVHMEATALMVHPVSIAGGSISVNPFIALNATLVDPGIVTIKGALVRAQTLNANAFAPLPPQYFTIADDLWYQRLVAIDEKDTVGNSSIVFFNTSDNFYVPSTGSVDPIPGSGWTVRAPSGARAVNTVTNPLPAINGGYFDAQNRKAVNFRNIEISTGYTSGNIGIGDRDFTFETMIRTTKSNQVLFVGENENTYNFQRTGIVLRDGKLALTFSKDARAGSVSANDEPLAFIGNKNIADGEWHHIIIQNRQTGVDRTQPRIQFWIDGQLDIQRYGNEMYVINRVGYNSPELNSYSDFTISAFGLGLSAMVEENEINLNYLAAINVVPVKAAVATATATATPNNKGRGNRGRALMLYFWPTQNAASGIYAPTSSSGFRSGIVGNNYHDYDQGSYGNDPDTFYQLSTYTTNGANKFYDWDIWPVPVVKFFAGDTFVGESHPILKDGITKSGTDKGTVYVDPVTDNERYLDLMTDLKDLSQFDMICFRNYPDQSVEQDEFGVNAKGVVDEYFNLLDKNLFADFLKSLRDAVDTGISLLITNPQLAVDMGFIDTYHEVSDLTGSGNEGNSDPYVPIKLDNPYGDGSEVYNYSQAYRTDSGDAFLDAYRNNYHQVVNTLADLTDDDGFIWTDEIKYQTDQSEFGELDRWWSHIEYKDSLQVGDRFLISTTPTFNQAYFATPLDAVRAGKVITKFADTYRFGAVERVNPYRNYATSIAVEPGTVVAGKQIGAKVFISFTDVVGKQQIGRVIGDGLGDSIEQKAVSLDTSYWISYAYSVGAITTEQRNDYLADISGQIVDWTTLTSRDTKYWTSDGSSIIGASSAYGDNEEILIDTAAAVQNKKTSPRTRSRRGRVKKVGSTGLVPNFQVIWGYTFPRLSVPVPSINTRGLLWLSERLEYGDELPLRPEAFESDAFMPQPVITGFKTATIAAQAAVAVGAMVETNLRSAGTTIAVLPLTATALFVEKGTFVSAEPATAVARTPQDIRTTTFESDQVVLYLVHVDPILYLREDVIK
jgi:hypothetical protein